MKNFLAAVVLLALAVGAVGTWRGWFEFSGRNENGKPQASVTVNMATFEQDRDALSKKLAEQAELLKTKTAGLREKAKNLSGDAKKKVEEQIERFTKNHESLEGKAKEIESATKDKFEAIKDSGHKALEDANKTLREHNDDR